MGIRDNRTWDETPRSHATTTSDGSINVNKWGQSYIDIIITITFYKKKLTSFDFLTIMLLEYSLGSFIVL